MQLSVLGAILAEHVWNGGTEADSVGETQAKPGGRGWGWEERSVVKDDGVSASCAILPILQHGTEMCFVLSIHLFEWLTMGYSLHFTAYFPVSITVQQQLWLSVRSSFTGRRKFPLPRIMRFFLSLKLYFHEASDYAIGRSFGSRCPGSHNLPVYTAAILSCIPGRI